MLAADNIELSFGFKTRNISERGSKGFLNRKRLPGFSERRLANDNCSCHPRLRPVFPTTMIIALPSATSVSLPCKLPEKEQ